MKNLSCLTLHTFIRYNYYCWQRFNSYSFKCFNKLVLSSKLMLFILNFRVISYVIWEQSNCWPEVKGIVFWTVARGYITWSMASEHAMETVESMHRSAKFQDPPNAVDFLGSGEGVFLLCFLGQIVTWQYKPNLLD